MIERRETIVLDSHDRTSLTDSSIDDVLFAFGNSGRDEDSTSSSGKTAGFLHLKQSGIFSVADDRQQAAIQQFTVAVAVTNDGVILSE